MRLTRRDLLAGLGLFGLAIPNSLAKAETVLLAEDSDRVRIFDESIQLSLSGQITVDRDGKEDKLPLEAKARHNYTERLSPTGRPAAMRIYREAVSVSAVSGEQVTKKLAKERCGIFVVSSPAGTDHFSLHSPLTRDEYELISEHFDTRFISDFLPGKEQSIGDSWAIPSQVAQAICHFDGIVKHDLKATLVALQGGMAEITIAGTADGVEHGSVVNVSVSARMTFDTAKRAITKIEWTQSDSRKQGPISPTMEAKVTISVTRTPVKEPSKELAELEANWPKDGKVPELMTQLRLAHKGGYEFVHPRDWHVVVNDDKHLVMRLLQRGEYLAQATFALWKPSAAAADRKAAIAEFVEATKKQPGWQPVKVQENGFLPGEAGRERYRISAIGKQDEQDVIQTFYLIPGADQYLAVATICNTGMIEKVGTKDAALVSAIEWSNKK